MKYMYMCVEATIPTFFVFLIFFQYLGLNQNLELARQALYHSSCATGPLVVILLLR
jgi:hypothetical protein